MPDRGQPSFGEDGARGQGGRLARWPQANHVRGRTVVRFHGGVMANTREHRYAVSLIWNGNLGTGTSGYRDYSRDYEIGADGKAAIHGSADPAFRSGTTSRASLSADSGRHHLVIPGDIISYRPGDFIGIRSLSVLQKMMQIAEPESTPLMRVRSPSASPSGRSGQAGIASPTRRSACPVRRRSR